jgi:heme/copper-type cytochrome/quinol oxidase subunit 1
MGGGQVYNVILTAHALLIVFFIVMPTLIGGFGNYLFPKLGQVRDFVLVRVNLQSFIILPGSLILLLTSLATDVGTGTGWTLYPQLRTEGHPGKSADLV